MPDYLAPGVFIEEQSFRARTIEGVDTSTAGFVGPCRYGPVVGVPALLTSLADFERIHGDGRDLDFGSPGAAAVCNHLWHAVRAFFEQGGRRLFVSRVFRPLSGDSATASPGDPPHADGHARGAVGSVRLLACHPGAMGNLQVRLGLRLGAALPGWEGLLEGDVVWIAAATAPVRTPRDLPLGVARRGEDGVWRVNGSTPAAQSLQRLTLQLEVLAADGRALASWAGLSLDPALAAGPVRLLADDRRDGLDLARDLMAGMQLRLQRAELAAAGGDIPRAWRLKLERGAGVAVQLAGGNDGLPPTPLAYPGQDDPPAGLRALAAVDVALVAAPGAGGSQRGADVAAVHAALLAHAEQMRHRVALLDPPRGLSPAEVRDFRHGLDSRHAALYYPWVTVAHPDGRALYLPPSAFVAGICARVDAERGVWKAPANEVLRGVTGLARELGSAEQEALNPLGINCLRRFEGRGLRVWGARTLSSDPEWKYLNLQRYFAYLADSIDRGTQWAVFEPNGEALWAAVRAVIEDFLQAEWRRGALLGDKPEQAFFVRCDRSVMTQQDLDQGRLVALVGAAMLRPAEFVVLRIGQWTADADRP